MRFAHSSTACFIVLAAAGCQRVAYVTLDKTQPAPSQPKIPYIAVDGTCTDANQANSGTVALLEATALKALAAKRGDQGPLTVSLLQDTKPETYRRVVSKAGSPFILPEEAGADVPVYEVRSVRSQGGVATVEIATAAGVKNVDLEYRAETFGWAWRPSEGKAPRAAEAIATKVAPEPKDVQQGEAVAEASQPKQYNWFERNILGKQTEERKAADAAKKEAQAKLKAEKDAAEAARKAEEASQPKRYNWFERNILGKRTEEQKAAEAAQKDAQAKAQKEAAEAAGKAEGASQPQQYNWFERTILGKQTEEQKAAKAKAKAEQEAADKEAAEKAAAAAKASEEAPSAEEAAHGIDGTAPASDTNWFERNVVRDPFWHKAVKQAEEQQPAAN